MSFYGDTSHGSSSRSSGLIFQVQIKPFPTHGLAGGIKHCSAACSWGSELLDVVCALPTKWSWGLSHPSPPGMVAMVSLPPWTKGQSSAGSSHRQTHWWCHITQVWGFPHLSTERLSFWTQLMKPWAGQERQKMRDDRTPSFNAFLLQLFSQIPLIHLSNIYRYW